MRVRAKEILGQKYSGYYDHKRRVPGEVFNLIPISRIMKDGKKIIISPENQFSEKWMEKVDKEVAAPQIKNETPTPEFAGEDVI